MTADHALIQLLKLEPLKKEDIVKYTGWDIIKTEKAIKACIESGSVKYRSGNGQYLPTMPNTQGSAIESCLQPSVSDMRGFWDS